MKLLKVACPGAYRRAQDLAVILSCPPIPERVRRGRRDAVLRADPCATRVAAPHVRHTPGPRLSAGDGSRSSNAPGDNYPDQRPVSTVAEAPAVRVETHPHPLRRPANPFQGQKNALDRIRSTCSARLVTDAGQADIDAAQADVAGERATAEERVPAGVNPASAARMTQPGRKDVMKSRTAITMVALAMGAVFAASFPGRGNHATRMGHTGTVRWTDRGLRQGLLRGGRRHARASAGRA